MHQLPFPVSNKTVSSPFALVHADLWGPAPIMSYTGFRFYLVLVDEFTKFTWTYLLKHKSDTFKVFTQFQAMVHTLSFLFQSRHFVLIVEGNSHQQILIILC
jgi:hypothetical protein